MMLFVQNAAKKNHAIHIYKHLFELNNNVWKH